MKGKAYSLRSRRTLYDTQGQPILNIQDKILTLFKQFMICPGESNGPELCHVKQQFAIGSNKLSVHFQNFDGKEINLSVKGSILERHAEIYAGDELVARLRRRLRDFSTYYVTVAPGVDAALIAAVCNCLDDAVNGKH
ncbi:hypothetical protein OE88DRAFT_1664212 [Heliocybe sulcata]|uniref:DUF567-domain-containing protein n=1 Tax=Heliocybe sulcata TaxID=5364 RepID=A0A5C3MTM7_9AGAM|nr:hypothetical protein OE88DRAFT_1664212 [Heliocybe sulcata]